MKIKNYIKFISFKNKVLSLLFIFQSCNFALASNIEDQEILKQYSNSYLNSYLEKIKDEFEKAPYTPTQGFLKNQFEKFCKEEEIEVSTWSPEEQASFRIDFPPISYEVGEDEKNLKVFIEDLLAYSNVGIGQKFYDLLSPLITEDVKASILQMMQRESQDKSFVYVYHATNNNVAAITEFNTELYRALGILDVKDENHKVLRPFANIFSSLETVSDLYIKYGDDSKPDFSQRCLSCVPYIFGFLKSDTPPLIYWLSNGSWKVRINLIDKIEEIFKTLKIDLSKEYIRENYQKILDSHKVAAWGGVMMQIKLSPEDLIIDEGAVGAPMIKNKYAYMCSAYGKTWAAEWMSTDYYAPHLHEIGSDVLETTLKARQGQPLNYAHLHQLRYMPKEIPAAVYLHYGRQHDSSKIEAFRQALFSQIQKDMQNIDREYLHSEGLLFTSPNL